MRPPATGKLLSFATMDCPVCKTPLLVIERESIELDWCPTCKGVWFDAGELELLADRIGKRHQPGMIGPDAENSPEARRRCPRCQRKMAKVLPTAGGKPLLDRCLEHGIWFDSGELATLMNELPDRDGEKPAVIEFLNNTFNSSRNKETPT